MSDDEISPYGTHQHASPRAVRTHTLVGEPARQATLDQAIEGVSRAAFSTAPYNDPAKPKPIPPPPPRREPEPETALCKYKNCRAARELGFLYCERHLSLSEHR